MARDSYTSYTCAENPPFGHTLCAENPGSGHTFAREKWAKVPTSVFLDVRLGREDIAVYATLAMIAPKPKSGVPKRFWAGGRKIARLAELPHRSVAKILLRLEECGHIRVFRDEARGRRQAYEFVSTAWLRVEKEATAARVTGYSGVTKYAGGGKVPEVERPVSLPKRLKQEAKSA